LLGRPVGELGGEGKEEEMVHATAGQQFQLERKWGEQPGGAAGGDDAHGMRLECDGHGGGTLIAGARALREHGAREVWVYVTHALLSKEGLARLAGAEDITGIVVTDTVPIDPRERPENLTVLTVSPLLAETIMNVFSDDSVSAIFGGENQLF